MEQIITTQNPTFHTPNSKQTEKNPSSRFISAEIEVAGMANYDNASDSRFSKIYQDFHALCVKWGVNVVRDGSLPSTGFEINTAPAGGDLYVDQISQICKFLIQNRSHVDGSCGLHIHMDARDMNYKKMIQYVKVWQKVEETMFDIIIPTRRTSHYCQPLGPQLVNQLAGCDTRQSVLRLIKNVYCDEGLSDIARVRVQRRPGCRYRALNLHSWMYRGTIENRMHHGTISPRKIINWSLLNTAILEAACQMTDRDIDSIGPNDGLAFLKAISPNDDLRSWIVERFKTFKKDSNGQKLFEVTPTDTVEPNELY